MPSIEKKIYEGSQHIYKNDTDTNVYIKPSAGNKLIIDAEMLTVAGTDTQIVYNKEGILSGSSALLFDETDLTAKNKIKCTEVDGCIDENNLGYNEIYQVGNSPQSVETSYNTLGRSLGTDVSFSKLSNDVAFACPYFIPLASEGGVSIWSSSGGAFSEYTSLLTSRNYTTDQYVNFCGINDDASISILTNRSGLGKLTAYKKTAGVWNVCSSELSSCDGVKITGIGNGTIVLTYDYNSNFKTLSFNGTNFVSQQSIFTPNLGSGSRDIPMSIMNGYLSYYYSGSIFIYGWSGTWTLFKTITAANTTSIDNYGSVFCYSSNGTLKIMENFVETGSFADSSVYCCTNGTYVFSGTGSLIKIYHKVSGVWTKSFNDYSLTSATKMSCNTSYLAVGRPSIGLYGTGVIFKIQSYTNSFLTKNTLKMLDTGISNGVSLNSSSELRMSSVGYGLIDSGYILDVKGQGLNVNGRTGSVNLTSDIGVSAMGVHSFTTSNYESLITTQSTSVSTGSVLLRGGLGCEKDIFCNHINTNNSNITVWGGNSQTLNIATITVLSTVFSNQIVSVSDGSITYSSGVFTAVKAGTYFFSYTLFPTVANLVYIIFCYKNGNTSDRYGPTAQNLTYSISEDFSVGTSFFVSLAAGDNMRLAVYPSITTALRNQKNLFQVYKLG